MQTRRDREFWRNVLIHVEMLMAFILPPSLGQVPPCHGFRLRRTHLCWTSSFLQADMACVWTLECRGGLFTTRSPVISLWTWNCDVQFRGLFSFYTVVAAAAAPEKGRGGGILRQNGGPKKSDFQIFRKCCRNHLWKSWNYLTTCFHSSYESEKKRQTEMATRFEWIVCVCVGNIRHENKHIWKTKSMVISKGRKRETGKVNVSPLHIRISIIAEDSPWGYKRHAHCHSHGSCF